MKKCYLILADGHIFEGTRLGAEGETMGELVFTTGVIGYIETLTDPSYYGQIVLQTFPQIGNYGMIHADRESRKSFVRGYVVREWCDLPSNFRCEENIDEYLKEQNIVAICGVDTREITRIIRESGVMNAKIVDEPGDNPTAGLKEYAIRNALKAVSTGEERICVPEGTVQYRVALIDYGAKLNIVRELNKRGCEVHIFPYDTSAEKILSIEPDGVMLTNGPGDPAENTECIEEIRALLGKKPIFGICLGHQLLALAAGAKTEKLKYGHRGANQPVKRLSDGRTFISSQNHGYAVRTDTLPEGAVLSFINANDHTCEGVDYPLLSAFSVQFHPEACSGPKDANFLFDRFIALMQGQEKA